MRTFALLFLATLCLSSAAVTVVAHEPAGPVSTGAETLDEAAHPAAGVVDAFHAALKRGETGTALSLLAQDALVFEAGGAERSKTEYAASHLAADAAFSAAVTTIVTRRLGRSAGILAWIATESKTTGRYRDREVDSVGTETMILRRDRAGWHIVHIHWSSARATP